MNQPVCRRCGLPVSFRKNARGNKTPRNPDDSDHFDVCRAAVYEAAKRGKHVKTQEYEYYEVQGQKRFYIERGSQLIVGKDFREVPDNDKLPWEG